VAGLGSQFHVYTADIAADDFHARAFGQSFGKSVGVLAMLHQHEVANLVGARTQFHMRNLPLPKDKGCPSPWVSGRQLFVEDKLAALVCVRQYYGHTVRPLHAEAFYGNPMPSLLQREGSPAQDAARGL
jgi:hypothetical protein